VRPELDLFSLPWAGILLALAGAVVLAVGAQFQHAGVNVVDDPDDGESALNLKQLWALVRRPSWLIGTAFLGVSILLQLSSYTFAPIIVVQPVGVVGLILTAAINARVSHVRLGRQAIRAILFCIVGVAMFVTIAAIEAQSQPISETQLIAILIVLGIVIVVLAVGFALLRRRITAIMYIVGAGILFGFVATLAKVVIDRVKTLLTQSITLGPTEVLTIGCVILLIAAAVLGSYFQQSAYANGPPDLVVAGLTVIDPFVAVIIGIVILGEAAGAPVWVIPAFVVAGAIAIYGVLQLARHHPQARHSAPAVASDPE
jgi:drug/metabolite transporter (DMT)-like permease